MFHPCFFFILCISPLGERLSIYTQLLQTLPQAEQGRAPQVYLLLRPQMMYLWLNLSLILPMTTRLSRLPLLLLVLL
jgi:hypothetical protein